MIGMSRHALVEIGGFEQQDNSAHPGQVVDAKLARSIHVIDDRPATNSRRHNMIGPAQCVDLDRHPVNFHFRHLGFAFAIVQGHGNSRAMASTDSNEVCDASAGASPPPLATAFSSARNAFND